MFGNALGLVGSAVGYSCREGENPTYHPLEIITLARLAFMKKGTKIRFDQYSLTPQKPSAMQSIDRSLSNSSHNELEFIEKIVKSAIRYYHPNQNENIKTIFNYVLTGLDQLLKTYHNVPNTKGTLTQIKLIITQNVTSGNEKTDSFKNELIIQEVKENQIPETIQKIKKIWNEKDLEEIVSWLDEAKKMQQGTDLETEEKALEPLKWIETLQLHKNERFKSVIKNISQIDI